MNISTALFDALAIPSDQKLFLIDVGARWGANPPWDQLDQKYINYLGFEPDEAECASLIEKYKTSSVDYIPIGLSDSAADHILYLTREPGCSSIFPPNMSFMSKLYLAERWNIQKEIPIKTVPLAQILDERGVVPDALKIDVQGAALNVLRGVGKHLDSILLVDVEVEFSAMYQGQALFGEVDQLLRKHGFELLDINKYYARRKILELKYSSRGQVIFADVLYVRSVENFYSVKMSIDERRTKLWNLIIMLSLYGHFDLAIEFAQHKQSAFTENEQLNIASAIKKYTAIPAWKLLLFNNKLMEKIGYILSLFGNSLQIQSRLFGWGSDQSAVCSRYKYYFHGRITRFFRK